MAQFTMDIQGKSQKFYVPSLGEYAIRQGQTFQEDGSLGKELIKYHGEHVRMNGPSALELLGNSKNTLDKLEGLEASASEIDSNINYGILPNAQNFLNYLKGARNVALVGDSISVGAYNDNNENVFSQRIKSTVDSLLKTKNIGFVTAYSTYQPFPIFHRHSTVGTWEIDVLDNESLNGMVIKSNTQSNHITFSSGASYQTKAKIHYKKQLDGFSFEVYINDVLIDTISETASTYTITETPYYNILPTSRNAIKIVVLSGMVEISGITYIANENDLMFDVLATGGRRTSYPSLDVITQISNKYDVVIWALGFNDLSSASAYHQNKINENFQELFTNIKTQNKYFVFLNFGWNTVTEDNWYMDKIDAAMVGYVNYIKIDVADSIVDKDGNKASAEYRYTTLKEWREGDLAHPNTKGSIRIGDYVKQKLGLNEKNITQYAVERPYTRLINTHSNGIGTGSNQMTISTAYEIKHANYTEVIANFTHWDLDGYTAIAIIGSEDKIIFDYSLERRGTSNITLGFTLAAYNGGVSINRDDAIDGNSPFTLRVRYFN